MPTRDRGRAVIGGVLAALVLYLLAFAAVSFGASERDATVVWIAAGCMLLAGGLLQLALSRARDEQLVSGKLLLWGPVAVIVVGLGLVVYAATGEPSGGVGFWGLCVAYVAAGQALAELRSRPGVRKHGLAVMVVSGVAFAIGIALCLLVSAPALGLAAFAVLLAPVGLTLYSEHVQCTRPRWPRRAVRLAPLLVLAGALLLWTVAGVPGVFTLVLLGLLLVLVGAIASSTQGDVLVVVAVVALVWAASPRPAEREPSIAPGARLPTLVALGDSYMSGEGADSYFEGTNNSGVNECRRSPTAYAHLAVTKRPASGLKRLAFLACSGDETADLRARQLGPLRAIVGRQDVNLQLVVISIGGNDAGFATIGQACVAPRGCVGRGQDWLDGLQAVAQDVRATYEEIREIVGRDVPVLAVPYPIPIRPEPCGYSLLARDEHRFLFQYVQQLNRAVEWAARTAGIGYVDTMPGAFSGEHRLRICDAPQDEIGVNFIALRSVDGVVDHAVNPGNWIHNSLHPNERGHERMADVLTDWVREHRDDQPAPIRRGDPAPFTTPTLPELVGDDDLKYCDGAREPAWCGREDEDWSITQVGVFLGIAAIPALLVVAGLWLVWLPVLAWTRPKWAGLGDRLAALVLGRT